MSLLLSQSLATRAQPVDPLGPMPPADVAIPSGFPGNPIDFFDDYSWRLFGAMVWPADPARPGDPKADAGLSATGPLVFETFKSNADTFQPGGADPGGFDAVAAANP